MSGAGELPRSYTHMRCDDTSVDHALIRTSTAANLYWNGATWFVLDQAGFRT
jgi:hypothetical protein